jgi:hypothetical protein
MPKSKRTVPLEGNRSTHPCLARLKAKSVLLPTIDPVKRTSLLRIDIPNSDGQLRPGLNANVTADIDAGDGLTIPFDSVLPTATRPQMLVFVDGNLANFIHAWFTLGGSLLNALTKMRNATIKSSAACKKESVLFRVGIL